MASVRHIDAFLLSREWRDTEEGVEVVLWARAAEAAVRVRVSRQEAVMFVPRDVMTHAGRRVPRPLTMFDGRPVDALYFRSQRGLVDERTRLREAGDTTLESDVKPSDRYVMERFVTAGLAIEGPARVERGVLCFDNPRIKTADVQGELTLLALDIETDGLGGPLLSAALATSGRERVFVRGDEPPDWDRGSGSVITFARDERALLMKLFAEIVAIDPDVLCGWNVTEFDLTVLDARARALGVPFTTSGSAWTSLRAPADTSSIRRPASIATSSPSIFAACTRASFAPSGSIRSASRSRASTRCRARTARRSRAKGRSSPSSSRRSMRRGARPWRLATLRSLERSRS